MPDEPILTISAQQPTPEVPSPSYLTPMILLFAAAVVLVGAFFATIVFNTSKQPTPTAIPSIAPPIGRVSATIAGTVYFQGYAPAGSYIAIAEKSETDNDFKDVISGIVPDKDGTTEWTWKDATAGHNYEMKATLKVSGKVVDQSAVQKVSAPAKSVSLPLISNIQPPAAVTTTISGQINLDGYAPSGSTLQVLVKTVNAVSFQAVASGINPTDNANWSWTQASAGTTYQVKAQLIDANSNIISTGDTQTITAPAGGELLNVYSTAKPAAPITTSGISGTITVNGNIPSGAYITLATRPSGTTTFNQVASNIPATNSVPFSWNNATSGSSYDVQAYLWINNQPNAASNIITVIAPSTADVLTINAQQPTQAPSSTSINVSCGGAQGGLVQATINFNTQANLSNAASYNIVVTSATQNQQVVNSTVNPPNPTSSQSITTTYVFQPGATYYAQYAYATSVGGQMSALSPSIQFACQ